MWVVATGVVIGQCKGQFRSRSIYADVSCVGLSVVAATCGCARTPVAVHVFLAVSSLWQRRVGALALPSLSTFTSGGVVVSGSDVWVRSHSRRYPRLDLAVLLSLAATCECARTPVAVHVYLAVSSLWQRCVGALALPSLSTLGSGGDESVAATCGCARTPVAVHAWIWG